MRTSLNEIHAIEKYVYGKLSQEDALAFEETMQHDLSLRMNVFLQRKVYTLLQVYHRKLRKQHIATVGNRLLHDKTKRSFQEDIFNIFNS